MPLVRISIVNLPKRLSRLSAFASLVRGFAYSPARRISIYLPRTAWVSCRASAWFVLVPRSNSLREPKSAYRDSFRSIGSNGYGGCP